MDQPFLLRPTSKQSQDNNIRLITNYNQRNLNLLQIVKRFEGLLLMTRKPAITLDHIKITYSRSPNLKDMLLKSKVYFQPQPKLSQPCCNQDA